MLRFLVAALIFLCACKEEDKQVKEAIKTTFSIQTMGKISPSYAGVFFIAVKIKEDLYLYSKNTCINRLKCENFMIRTSTSFFNLRDSVTKTILMPFKKSLSLPAKMIVFAGEEKCALDESKPCLEIFQEFSNEKVFGKVDESAVIIHLQSDENNPKNMLSVQLSTFSKNY
jgi:hypothetical protein